MNRPHVEKSVLFSDEFDRILTPEEKSDFSRILQLRVVVRDWNRLYAAQINQAFLHHFGPDKAPQQIENFRDLGSRVEYLATTDAVLEEKNRRDLSTLREQYEQIWKWLLDTLIPQLEKAVNDMKVFTAQLPQDDSAR